MIKHIPAADRYFADHGWLKTHWLFSFDTYYDPSNLHWGILRVFNDDWVAAGKGFGTHPHRDMEIVTIVHAGELTHEDSTGTKGVIRPGDVQYMSAGTGILHSEYNHGTEPVELYQIWILPRQHNLKPGYAQKFFGELSPNVLHALVSGEDKPEAIAMHADATIYGATLKAGETVTHTSLPTRRHFLYVTDGGLTVNDTALASRDQARIKDESTLKIHAETDSKFILIDVAATA